MSKHGQPLPMSEIGLPKQLKGSRIISEMLRGARGADGDNPYVDRGG